METGRSAAFVAAVVLASGLAGCSTGDDGAIETSVVEENATRAANATLPEGRGESAGLQETNRTEAGVGGIEHRHDYWKGAETIVVFDGSFWLDGTPLFPDGQGTAPRSVAYVKLPNGSLVFEGTDRITLDVASPALHNGAAQHPAPAALKLQVMTAADAGFREPVDVAPGQPLEIPVAPKETDMPHATGSLWAFRFSSDRVEDAQWRLTITIHKGADVLDWPGHPDLYAETDERVVLDAHVSTRRTGIFGTTLYDDQGTWVAPEKLITWGTSRLEVYVNVTGFRGELDAEPVSFNLEFHNATVIGPEANTGQSVYDRDPPADKVAYNFTVRVNDYGMDSPYQPASRWGFRMMATYGAQGARATLCPGCFPYEIEYDVRIVAVHEPEDVARPQTGTGA